MASTSNGVSRFFSSKLSGRRREEIKSLPSEHCSHMESEDRHIIQIANMTNASLTTKKGYEVRFRERAQITIRYPIYVGDEPLKSKHRAMLFASSISYFYRDDYMQIQNPVHMSLMGQVLGILAVYLDTRSFFDLGLEKVFRESGFRIEPYELQTMQEIEENMREVCDFVCSKLDIDFDENYSFMEVIATSLLVLIGKNVTDNAREGWFRNRWRGLAAVLDVRIPKENMEVPSLGPCQALYTTASAHIPIRVCIFKTLRALANVSGNNQHYLFSRILGLLKWTEMGHIYMIHKFIYEQNPEILAFPELSGYETSPMTHVNRFLMNYTPEDRPYLKLLFDHDELIPLQVGNMMHFHAAALAIGQMTNPSMKNIGTRYPEEIKAFQERVVTYMNQKAQLGPSYAAYAYRPLQEIELRRKLVDALESQTSSSSPGMAADQLPPQRE
ncbi:nucleoprotein [Hymenopteran arli-related virus OKIAV98]|uniref:Nucleoprotein n=1 Tax=Hymenopteran arli-related virus OKIAV98 TaxID=2792565 RepID=A0AAE7P4N5_9MONO|nr:nucleoprotein [Hymenopteran arli-related virus OKIAV98]QPL15291.1 nucleoprotein [Hymenopteran arli-related virus OKIAV98]